MHIRGRHRDVMQITRLLFDEKGNYAGVEKPRDPLTPAELTGTLMGVIIRVECRNYPEFWLEIELEDEDLHAIATAKIHAHHEQSKYERLDAGHITLRGAAKICPVCNRPDNDIAIDHAYCHEEIRDEPDRPRH